jgi:Fe-S-cluster containining protein
MLFPYSDILDRSPEVQACLSQLMDLFAGMDRAYDDVARHYGFQCNGCADNCCLTLFHHHTLLELFLLARGFDALSASRRAALLTDAESFYRAIQSAGPGHQPLRRMCPLNDNGRCVLYDTRPMICRLHGIPHALHRPGGGIVTGPGCGAFDRHCSGPTRLRLDRTPYYIEMAKLEGDLKQRLGVTTKIKMTVAEMLTVIGGLCKPR